MIGVIILISPQTLAHSPSMRPQIPPSASDYDDSSLSQEMNSTLTYDVQSGETLGFLLSLDSEFNYTSAEDPELDQNNTFQLQDYGLFKNIKSISSINNSTVIEIDNFASLPSSPVNFTNPDDWTYSSTSTYIKNTTYESILTPMYFVPQDIFISDIMQNNSAFLQRWLEGSHIQGINMAYFYNLIDDTFIVNNLEIDLENSSNLSGFYNASWVIHGNTTSGLEINIETSLQTNLSLSSRHVLNSSNWNFFFNATVVNATTSEVLTHYRDIARSYFRLMHQGTNLFPIPEKSTTTFTDTYYDYDEYEFQDMYGGFGYIFGFLLAFVAIVIVVVVIIVALTRNRNPFQRRPPIRSEKLYRSPYIGRMDTPPALTQTKEWDSLNPHQYKGRMNTPPAMPKSKFCPNCGNQFTSNMMQLLQSKKIVYCQYCGEQLDPFI